MVNDGVLKMALPTIQPTVTITPNLPHDGMSRFKQFQSRIPVSREKWRQLVRAGRAPQPIYLSSTCVMYRNSEIHAWLADPVNYRAEVAA
jgi:predicted DNA-binding transcriptional regulator AlpA